MRHLTVAPSRLESETSFLWSCPSDRARMACDIQIDDRDHLFYMSGNSYSPGFSWGGSIGSFHLAGKSAGLLPGMMQRAWFEIDPHGEVTCVRLGTRWIESAASAASIPAPVLALVPGVAS